MMPPGVDLDEGELVRIEAMIESMTGTERHDPHALVREPSRVRRIARGSGTPEQAVQELVQKFLFMKQMMEGFGGGGGGMLGRMPGMKHLNMARNVRRAMKSGKLPMPDQMGGGIPGMGPGGMPAGFPGMGGMPGGFPGMPGGFPGMGGMPGGFPGFPGMGGIGGGMGQDDTPKMRTLTRSEKNARKNQRKREKDARKKNRKR
jgi:signal recognition particle subunit SRP54